MGNQARKVNTLIPHTAFREESATRNQGQATASAVCPPRLAATAAWIFKGPPGHHPIDPRSTNGPQKLTSKRGHSACGHLGDPSNPLETPASHSCPRRAQAILGCARQHELT